MIDKTKLEEGTSLLPRWNKDGLITAIAIDVNDKSVLMLAHMNEQALQETLSSRYAHYWSRSRQKLWKKGESSGNTQYVHDLYIDCDQDAVIVVVTQNGGKACHTGRKSCFYRSYDFDNKQLEFVE